MSDFIQLSIEKTGVATVTFNNPENLNAFSPECFDQLIATLDQLKADREVRAVIFTGSGQAFSAGGSYDFLREVTELSPVETKEAVYARFAGGIKAVKLFPKPTVAAVNGPAAGAGCELAIACDFRIVSAAAVFREVWVKIGVLCPLGGMFLLPRLVGLTKATEMLMLGTKVGGEEAVSIGLANRLVEAEELLPEAIRWAEELAQGAPLALAAIKEGLLRGMDSTLESEWARAVYAQSMLISSNDCKEGIDAMITKRKPQFTGT